MTISNEEILKLAKEDGEFAAQLVLTIDMLAEQVKNLNARIEKLEAGEPAKLRLVQDG